MKKMIYVFVLILLALGMLYLTSPELVANKNVSVEINNERYKKLEASKKNLNKSELLVKNSFNEGSKTSVSSSVNEGVDNEKLKKFEDKFVMVEHKTLVPLDPTNEFSFYKLMDNLESLGSHSSISWDNKSKFTNSFYNNSQGSTTLQRMVCGESSCLAMVEYTDMGEFDNYLGRVQSYKEAPINSLSVQLDKNKNLAYLSFSSDPEVNGVMVK